MECGRRRGDALSRGSPLILCCVQHDGFPSDIQRGASIYPAERNRYGPTNRRPVEEVTFAETWGKPWHA